MDIYQERIGSRFIYTETLWASLEVIPENNPTVGFAAYARCEIPAWSMLGVYAGEIKKDSGTSSKAKVSDAYMIEMDKTVYNNKYSVSANLRGGFSRFFCHLPQGKIYYSKEKDTPQLRNHIFNMTGINNRPGDAEKLFAVMEAGCQTFSDTLSAVQDRPHDLD